MKIFQKRFIKILITLILGLTLSCGQGENASETVPANENVLRFDTFAPLTTLNPQDDNAPGSGGALAFALLYSHLFQPDESGELKPDLAISWIYDMETFTWTIVLRDNALFHDGRPVTSQDVIYSLFFSGPNTDGYLIDDIREILPISDTQLCIHLKKNDPDFAKKIAFIFVVPHYANSPIKAHDKASPPVGSGPFLFSSITGDSKLILKANKHYYLNPPSIDSVMFFYEPDREKSWARLLAGETDIVFEISPKDHEIMKQYGDRFYFDYYPMHRYSILLYNTTDILFSDAMVRQALTQAIDRDYIVSHFLNGYGKVAAGPMGIDSPYHNPEVVPLPYDPEKSFELLKAAGWTESHKDHYLYKDGKLFQFTLNVIREFPLDHAIARYIKLCFNDIGVQMNIDYVSIGSIAEKYSKNNDFQAVLTEFSDGSRVPEWHKDFWTPSYGGKSKAGCFSHPEVTQLLEQAFSETDPVQKKLLLQKADALIADLQPGTFLFHKIAIDVMSKRFLLISPFSLDDTGIWRLRNAVAKP